MKHRLHLAYKTWLLLLQLTLPSAVQAQFNFTTNNDAITITAYTGSGGAVTIPDTTNGWPVTSIEDYAFQYTALTSLTIGTNVTSIGKYTFQNCYSLTSVTIPNSVTSIGEHAFSVCIGLTSVTIPNSVTSIGYATFTQCHSLTNVMIGSSVTSIGEGAFWSCTNLAKVTIGNSVTSIGKVTFQYCMSLTSVTIPGSVTNIGTSAFSGCYNLTRVYFKGNAPTAASSMFTGDGSVTVYYLPGTTGWGDFAQSTGLTPVLWNPSMQTPDANFVVQANQFSFTITGTTNIPIVIDARTDLAGASWIPLQTCILTNGSIYFSDPAWANYPNRFYRIRSP